MQGQVRWVEGEDGVYRSPDFEQWDPDADWEIETPWGSVSASGTRVKIQDRLVPLWFERRVQPDQDQPGHLVRFEAMDGAVRLTRVEIHAAEGGAGIQQKDLDSLKVSSYWAYLSSLSDPESEWPPNDAASARARDFQRVASGGRRNRKITPELLERVAEVYRDHIGPGPTKAVAEHFYVSHSQASTYVRLAREAGLLPKTERGRKRA